MNKLDFLQAIGEVEDKDIQEAAYLSGAKRNRKKWIAAFSVAAVLTLVLLATQSWGQRQADQTGSESDPAVSSEQQTAPKRGRILSGNRGMAEELGHLPFQADIRPVLAKPETLILTEEQKEEFGSLIYSLATDPVFAYLFEIQNLSEAEKLAYMERRAAKQEKAVQAGGILSLNAVMEQRANGETVYRDDYAGCCLSPEGDKLLVFVTDHAGSMQEWALSVIPSYLKDTLEFRAVQYTYNELLAREEELVEAVLEAGMDIYSYGIRESMNRIVIAVDAENVIPLCKLIRRNGWESCLMASVGSQNKAESPEQ